MATTDANFPCSLIVHIPFPSSRLATAAIRTLSVDQELSPLVQRTFDLLGATSEQSNAIQKDPFKASLLVNAAPTKPLNALSIAEHTEATKPSCQEPHKSVLEVRYRATTNRMLRVAVNGFFESLGTIIQVMEELDLDVLHEKGIEGLEGVQGVEQGMTGSTG